jgi:hypothetical protein
LSGVGWGAASAAFPYPWWYAFGDYAAPTPAVLTLAEIDVAAVAGLLAGHGLQLQRVADGAAIPGSYWGECEAGLIADTVFARADTPVHSLLHEACHLLVMPASRRASVHTDASDSVLEEDAACYLQILLARQLPGVGSARLMADMDAWGYSFRLGSARAWFEHDAEDARAFVQALGFCTAVEPRVAVDLMPAN